MDVNEYVFHPGGTYDVDGDVAAVGFIPRTGNFHGYSEGAREYELVKGTPFWAVLDYNLSANTDVPIYAVYALTTDGLNDRVVWLECNTADDLANQYSLLKWTDEAWDDAEKRWRIATNRPLIDNLLV